VPPYMTPMFCFLCTTMHHTHYAAGKKTQKQKQKKN
jgi:hypothetical protein